VKMIEKVGAAHKYDYCFKSGLFEKKERFRV
jgi:hypothetical protein